jgi:hypothetical protein
LTCVTKDKTEGFHADDDDEVWELIKGRILFNRLETMNFKGRVTTLNQSVVYLMLNIIMIKLNNNNYLGMNGRENEGTPTQDSFFFNVNVSSKYNYLQIQVNDSTSQTRDMCWKLYEDMTYFQGNVRHARYPKY